MRPRHTHIKTAGYSTHGSHTNSKHNNLDTSKSAHGIIVNSDKNSEVTESIMLLLK